MKHKKAIPNFLSLKKLTKFKVNNVISKASASSLVRAVELRLCLETREIMLMFSTIYNNTAYLFYSWHLLLLLTRNTLLVWIHCYSLNNDLHKYRAVLFRDNINFTHDENKILWPKHESVIKL